MKDWQTHCVELGFVLMMISVAAFIVDFGWEGLVLRHALGAIAACCMTTGALGGTSIIIGLYFED
jgi:hypothetical protein